MFVVAMAASGGDLRVRAKQNEVTPAAECKSEIGQLLIKNGYQRVPLECPKLGTFLIELPIDGKRLSLLVDTGANQTVLSAPAIKAKGLQVKLSDGEAVSYAGIGGAKTTGKYALVKSLAIGTLRPIPFTAFVSDDPVVYERKEKNQSSTCDGILGIDLIDYFSAVIDCGEPAMYFIDPIAREIALQGRWQSVSVVSNGLARENIQSEQWNVVIDGSKVRFWDGNSDFKLTLRLNSLNLKTRQMDWELKKGSSFQWIYKCEKDVLTICGQLGGETSLTRPKEYKSTKDNGYTLIVFKRLQKDER